jgi:glycosyltransferase involved in cell wall biosynthesis
MQAAVDRLRRLHHRFERLQVTCSSGRDTLLTVGVPPEKIVTLPEGIDTRMFYPPSPEERLAARAELGISPDARVVGCFQKDGEGWDEGTSPKLIKGPDVLVDCLIRLHAVHPVHAIIPGPSRGYVKDALTRAGIPHVAPGLVPRARLPRLYHALDLYISPSRDEGGPAGLLEAMASAVPVVSSRAGMAPDLIQHGLNGFLADVGDARGLADSAAEVFESDARRLAVGSLGRAAVEPLDWSVLAPQYAAALYAGSASDAHLHSH